MIAGESVSIRTGAPGDGARLAAIGQATFLESYAGDLEGADILAHCARHHGAELYEAWLADPARTIFLAELRGAPVGYAVLGPPDLPLPDVGPRDAEVKRLYVLHRFHGVGLGRSLMQTCLDAASGARFRRALLGVYARNTGAIAFYRRLGFREAGTRRFLVGETWCDDLILERDV